MATYELSSDKLSVTLSSLGAELRSARIGGCEYLWQGDPAFWAGRAPNLFPICGRLFEKRYTYEGREYTMDLHGFARFEEYEAVPDADGLGVRFHLDPNERTREQYPFEFSLDIAYRLKGARLGIEILVANAGPGPLPFAYGAHPGFNVPLGGDGAFEDWFLEFGADCSPDQFVLSASCLQTGRRKAFPLAPGNRISLRHNLFDDDAVFLSRCADSVTLASAKSPRAVTMRYPDMPYLGVWHRPHTEAPYVCIEPWCGLPAYDGEIEDFATRPDMFRLAPGATKRLGYEIEFR